MLLDRECDDCAVVSVAGEQQMTDHLTLMELIAVVDRSAHARSQLQLGGLRRLRCHHCNDQERGYVATAHGDYCELLSDPRGAPLDQVLTRESASMARSMSSTML